MIIVFKTMNISPPEYLREFKLKASEAKERSSKLKEPGLIPRKKDGSHMKGRGGGAIWKFSF